MTVSSLLSAFLANYNGLIEMKKEKGVGKGESSLLEKRQEEEEGTRAIFDQLLINEGRTSTFLDKISSINFFFRKE